MHWKECENIILKYFWSAVQFWNLEITVLDQLFSCNLEKPSSLTTIVSKIEFNRNLELLCLSPPFCEEKL